MSQIYYVYEHWRPDVSACFYVGKGQKRRAQDMIRRNPQHKNIQNKLASLGLAVDVRIIASCLTEAEAFDLEKIQISSHGKGQLCNFTDGGEGTTGLRHSEASRRQRSSSMKGNTRGLGTKQPPEARAKISAARKGKPLSPEHRQKLAKAQQARFSKKEEREKISKTKKGKWISPEFREKHAEAVRRNAQTPEYRERLSMSGKLAWADPEKRSRIMSGRG